MKKLLCLVIGLGLLPAVPAFGQDKTSPPMSQPAPAPSLTKFDLDFPGGTPGELVAAIERGMGHPLNAIVPLDYAHVKIPPLKMRGVNVAELFQALTRSSRNAFFLSSGAPVENNFGFVTQGVPSDGSVWTFSLIGIGNPPHERISRFYLLTPYLERGLTVDDITTAIRTGWKMLGEDPPPALSFHAETKLLIVVGRENQLGTVEGVLRALAGMPYKPAAKLEPAQAEQAKPGT